MRTNARANSCSRKQIQESDVIANYLNGKTREAMSKDEGSGDLSGVSSLKLCCGSFPDRADLFESGSRMRTNARANSCPLKQIQESDVIANYLNGETSEAMSKNEGSGDLLGLSSLQLCCSSSPDVANLLELAGTSASFQLEVMETAREDLFRKIKNEAENHCARIKEMALDEIINNKRPSSEVKKEYSQMISETIQSMEEQLYTLIDSRELNMQQIKSCVLKDLADTVEKSLKPEEKIFFDRKNVGALASQCHKSVMTLHLFLECFFVLGAYVYACKKSIIPFYF